MKKFWQVLAPNVGNSRRRERVLEKQVENIANGLAICDNPSGIKNSIFEHNGETENCMLV